MGQDDMNQAEIKDWLDGFRFTPLVELDRLYSLGLTLYSADHPKMIALIKETLPYSEYSKLDADHKALGARHQELQHILGGIRRVTTQARHKAFCEVLADVAAKRLSRETYAILVDEVHDLMRGTGWEI
jgi:hypothetical protein